jgi:hypothetical protein
MELGNIVAKNHGSDVDKESHPEEEIRWRLEGGSRK